MADDTKVDFYFYYHSNHLGSTNFVTRVAKSEDEDKPRHEMYGHVEYIPFGETWIEEREVLPFGGSKSNRYLFTSKEFDQETRLYYYGARYYDPKTSIWLSADPILDSYIDGSPNNGVFNHFNLNLYAYTAQNPVKYTDPDGKFILIGNIPPILRPVGVIPRSLGRVTGVRHGKGSWRTVQQSSKPQSPWQSNYDKPVGEWYKGGQVKDFPKDHSLWNKTPRAIDKLVKQKVPNKKGKKVPTEDAIEAKSFRKIFRRADSRYKEKGKSAPKSNPKSRTNSWSSNNAPGDEVDDGGKNSYGPDRSGSNKEMETPKGEYGKDYF